LQLLVLLLLLLLLGNLVLLRTLITLQLWVSLKPACVAVLWLIVFLGLVRFCFSERNALTITLSFLEQSETFPS
jgi:hypothetical protein